MKSYQLCGLVAAICAAIGSRLEGAPMIGLAFSLFGACAGLVALALWWKG